MSKKKSSQSQNDKWQTFAEQQAEEAEMLKDTAPEANDGPELVDPEVAAESRAGLDYPSHEALEQELNALEMKVSEYKDQAIRAKAELENVRRRAERDVQQAHQYGSSKLLNDLLPVMDSILRGLEGCQPNDPHAEGMKLTLDLLEKTLERHGVSIIDPALGEPFNPETQEAMSMQPAQGAKSNTVLQVLQKGYELNGRVLRAAMVIVAS